MNRDSEILSYITRTDGTLIPQRCTRNILNKRGYLGYLQYRYCDNTTGSIKEVLYRLVHHINTIPVCKNCGKPVIFDAGNMMYPQYCSAKCRNTSPEVLSKNSAAVSIALRTAYNEHGDDIKQKRANTLHTAYNCSTSSPFSSDTVRAQAKNTVLEKYGVDNVMKLPEYRAYSVNGMRNKSVELWKSRGLNIEYTDHDTVIIHNCCQIHPDIEMDIKMFNNRTHDKRYQTSILCPVCRPNYDFSGPEKILKDFFDSYGIHYIINDRKTIAPLELDFYFPDNKFAIEFNGIFFHSEESGKDKNYHKNKSELCDARGIQLIHIWENDWINNRELILDMLRIKFGIFSKKIMARKCTVSAVSPDDYRKFISQYHLQGYVPASYRYGLYYNGELVSVMSFGKLRKVLGSVNKTGIYELYRYCVKSGYIISGGASKLFKYAVNDMPGVKGIMTYAKRDWSTGNLYKKLGFNFIGYTEPNYIWVDSHGNCVSRYASRKDKIVKTPAEKLMTETAIMESRGYYKCYDSGNLKFVWEYDKDN